MSSTEHPPLNLPVAPPRPAQRRKIPNNNNSNGQQQPQPRQRINAEQPSPLLRKATTNSLGQQQQQQQQQQLPMSLESITSDMSMDISDITVEIEKLNKEIDAGNPEEAIKDSTRLMKEIDHHMEVSFEIMEERNNMVREFLKERETNERKYKTRTDDMIANFNKKMKALEKSLSFVEEEQQLPPGFSSVYVQTQPLNVKQTGVQVTLFNNNNDNDNLENADISNVIDAVASNVNEVAQERYLRERDLVKHRFMFQQNKIDLKCIDRALDVLQREMTNVKDRNIHNGEEEMDEKANELVNAFLKDHPDAASNYPFTKYLEGNTKASSVPRNSMLEKYIKTGDPSILFTDNDENVSKDRDQAILDKLEPYRKRYQDAVFGDKKHRAENDFQKRLDLLYNTCKEMERSKNKLRNVMDSLIQKTGVSSSHLETLLSEANHDGSNNDDHMDLARRLTQELGDSLEVSRLVEYVHEVKEREERLASHVACSTDCYWKIRAMELCNFNKDLLTQKDRLLKELQGDLIGDEAGDLFHGILDHPQVIVDLEPKIGKDLIRDLEFVDWTPTHGNTDDQSSRTKAVDLIHYCEEPIETILVKYEEEIDKLREDGCKARVLEDIYENHIPCVTKVTRETYNGLVNEIQNLNNDKENKCSKHQKIVAEMKDLRGRKIDLIKAEHDLQQQRKNLGKTVTSLNKQITGRLVYSDEINENTTNEDWIIEVNKQIKRLEDKVSDQKYLTSLDANDQLTSDVTKRIGSLRRGLSQLIPFVNKNKLPVLAKDDVVVPSQAEIDHILKEKEALSKLLLDVENRIQEIITSEGYESSACGSGTMENIEEVQFDLHSPTGIELKDFLNEKLSDTKGKLSEVNRELTKREIDPKQFIDIETRCRGLSRKIRDIEKRIRREPMLEQTNNIIDIDKEIDRLMNELSKHGCGEDTRYDKKHEEELIEARTHAVQKFKELISNEKRQDSEHSVSVALKCLLAERDRVQHDVLSLEEDISDLNVIKVVLAESGLTTIEEKSTELSGQILEKKATNLNRIMATANKRLNYFISMVRIKMKEKLQEASNSNWENKERVSREEKQKLGTCLKGVVKDIQNIEVDLEEYGEYKMNGCGDIENVKLKELIQEKKDTMRRLNELSDKGDSGADVVGGGDIKIKKEILIQHLSEVNEKLEDEEFVLHQKLTELQGVKRDLEVKLSDCIEIDDLKQILAELDKKETRVGDSDEGQDTECELVKLIKERASVTENVKQVLYHAPQEKGKIKKITDLLENIDVAILMHIDEVLAKLDSAPHIDSESQLEAYDLLASTANAFTFMRDQEELREALVIANFNDSYSASVQEVSATRDEISNLENLKRKIDAFEQRAITPQDVGKLTKMKELNESKLERLLKKIKDLNQLVEIQRKFDRKLRRTSDPTLSDFEDVSVTTEKINNELKSIIQNYDNNVTASNHHNSKDNDSGDSRKPVLRGSRHPPKNNASQKLNSILEERDQMLSQLFEIEREMADGVASKVRRRQLVEQKNELTQKLESIEDSIVSSEYLNAVEGGKNQSAERSFSPRSTSSRASFTMHLDERDNVMKELFMLTKQKDELRMMVTDEASQQSQMKDVESQERAIRDKLHEVNLRLFGNLDAASGGGGIQTKQQDSPGIITTMKDIVKGSDLDDEIKRLEKEHCDGDVIHLQGGGDHTIVFKEPEEADCLHEIKQLEKKMKIESMKKALRSLEEEKKIIESTMKSGGSNAAKEKTKLLADLKTQLKKNKAELAEEQAVLEMLVKKRSYEGKMSDLQKQIRYHCGREGGGHSGNVEDNSRSHQHHHHHEPTLLKEHKREKVELEKKLDQIDSTIHRYFGSMERTVDGMLQTKDSVEMETLQAVKDCKSVTADKSVGGGSSNVNAAKSFQDKSIKDLLKERANAMNRIKEIDQVLGSNEQSQRKDELTRKLRRCFEEEKKSNDEINALRQKEQILKLKLDEMEINENEDDDQDHLRKVLGGGLYEVVLSPATATMDKDSRLHDLKDYLDELTIEDYITDLKNLSKLQTDQVSLVKSELSDLKDKVKILQNELDEASQVQDRFKMKLGENLYDVVSGEPSSDGMLSGLENVDSQLNRGLTLEDILKDRLKEIVDLKKNIGETSECQSVREVSLLQEVESLREDLTLSTDRMNSLVESEQNLRQELRSVRARLQEATEDKSSIQENLDEENKTIKRLKDQLSNMENRVKIHDGDHELIGKQENEIEAYKERVLKTESRKDQIQKDLDGLKQKYLALSSEHSNDALNHQMEMKELREKLQEEKNCAVKKKDVMLASMEEENQKLIDKIGEQETLYKTNIHKHLEKVRGKEMETKTALVEIERLKDQHRRLEEQKMNFVAENKRMVLKSKEIETSHQRELGLRKDEIANLNMKIDGLVKEIQSKKKFEDMYRALETELQEKRNRLLEQEHTIENHEKNRGLAMMSLNNELNAVKLENDGLSEEILKLKHELKRHKSIEALTENLDQKEMALNTEVSRFNEEKILFEESVQDFLRRKSMVELKVKQEHQQMSLKLLKTAQEERDRFSDELIKVNRELHQAKNEARRLRMNLKEKEQTSAHVQSTMVRAIEDECTRKLDEQGKLHDKEKETILFAYQEERLKWEDEMDSLKTNAQKETLKKLAEQRNDYEVELQKQIKLYLQHNQEELSEERDKCIELEKQKCTMVQQFEDEKMKMNKKFDSQKMTMSEIIKRLLKHLMMVKKQRVRLRKSYENEIIDLEDRLETEKELFQEQDIPTRDIGNSDILPNDTEYIEQTTKRKNNNKTLTALSRSYSNSSDILSTFAAATSKKPNKRLNKSEDNLTPSPEPSPRMRSSDCASRCSLTLTELRELFYMGDYKDFMMTDDSSSFEDEKESLHKNMKEQYENKLRTETDLLMKRLLELSDELDRLRLNH